MTKFGDDGHERRIVHINHSFSVGMLSTLQNDPLNLERGITNFSEKK